MKLNRETVNAIGSDIASKTKGKILDDRTFRSFYGRSPDEVLELWELCCDDIPKTKLKHLFWSLMHMKLYMPLEVMVTLVNTSKPTYEKWTWVWIEAIAKKHTEIIDWNKRNRTVPKNVWCRVTVDGTDFGIGEPFPFNKKWKSPKMKGAAVKYEVAISIFSGDIVWIYGPHRGGKHDITIFKEKLKDMLEEDEMVEADRGYKGLCEFIRTNFDYESAAEGMEKSELRSRHETVNRRFKSWGILQQAFRSDRRRHQFVFYAIAVMTQMSIDNGNVLFSCEPITRKKVFYHI